MYQCVKNYRKLLKKKTKMKRRAKENLIEFKDYPYC